MWGHIITVQVEVTGAASGTPTKDGVEGDACLPVVAGCRGSREVSVEGALLDSVPATAVGLLFVVPVGLLDRGHLWIGERLIGAEI